jgi:tetratricopeptide (TPR) repeat protein
MRQLLYFFVLTSAFSSYAQEKTLQLASNRESTTKEGLNVIALDVRFIPLFGTKKKAEEEIKKNAEFIAQCVQYFEDKTKASKFFAERGWEYLGDGLIDTAIHRFNMSYMLDPTNVEAYWGLGSASYQKNNFEESAQLLRRGLELAPDNAMLMVDVATVQIACFKEKRNCDDIDDAMRLLEKSVQLDSTNANAWLKYAIGEYQLEHYDKAWECLHKCKALDLSFVDMGCVQELVAKKEDPLGVFK